MAATSPIQANLPTTLPASPLLRPLHLWHLTSFDAPTVAVLWTLAFARAAHLTLPLWIPLVLALGTWAVYLFDRLLDARSRATTLQARHHFHWRHRRLCFPLAAASLLAALVIAHSQMPPSARPRNTLLALAALAYVAAVHLPAHLPASRARIPKEFLVGLIFSLACVLPVAARTPAPLTLAPVALAAILLAWLNCHAIDSWESHRTSTRIPAPTLAAACLAAALTLALVHQPAQAALLACFSLSALLLALLNRRSTTLAPLTLRTLADAVLLTPLLLFLLPALA